MVKLKNNGHYIRPEFLQITIIIALLAASIAIWYKWPLIVNYFIDSSYLKNTEESGMARLGQFGDLFGGLTSLFTLFALMFSIYVNLLQYQQFKSIKRREILDNHRYFLGVSSNDKDILDTLYMIEYDDFYYEGGYDENEDTIHQVFMDKRVTNSTNDLNHHNEVEQKVDKLLSHFEEILIYYNDNLLDKRLAVSMIKRIDMALSNDGVIAYLVMVARLYGGFEISPYSMLSKRANLY